MVRCCLQLAVAAAAAAAVVCKPYSSCCCADHSSRPSAGSVVVEVDGEQVAKVA